MRCILAGCLGVTFGFTLTASAQQPANAAKEPAVTLGPPTVALGAPRPLTGRGDIAACRYDVVARGKSEDKPMPPGPSLPANPGNVAAPLPAPSPLTPAAPTAPSTPAPPTFGENPIASGPVTSGPIFGETAPPGPLPGTNVNIADPNWAPLPGGSFAVDSRPAGSNLYGSAEVLFWWIQRGSLPPLLTATPVAGPGAGVPVVVFGGGGTDTADQGRIGARFTAGWWVDPCQNFGLVGSYFFLNSRGDQFTAYSNGTDVLARPFLNINPAVGGTAVTPVLDREIIAVPGLANGTFHAQTTDSLWGADINARMNLLNGCCGRLDGLVGFRYLHFDEKLTIGETFQGIAGPNAGRMGALLDSFKVNDNFYGGQIGMISEVHRGPWSLETTWKVALGTTTQSVSASGAQMGVNEFGMPVSGAGLFVQPSNAGNHNHSVFSVVPEVTLNVGYQLAQHMKVFAGYDFLYWSNMMRVGGAIDTTLDLNSRTFPLTQPPGAFRPAVQFHDTGFWAQGINVGLQFTW
jgi:hypothetical protein